MTSKELQRKDIDLNQVLLYLKSLCEWLQNKTLVFSGCCQRFIHTGDRNSDCLIIIVSYIFRIYIKVNNK